MEVGRPPSIALFVVVRLRRQGKTPAGVFRDCRRRGVGAARPAETQNVAGLRKACNWATMAAARRKNFAITEKQRVFTGYTVGVDFADSSVCNQQEPSGGIECPQPVTIAAAF